MRTLKFIVNELIIEQDPNCNFDNLVPGTEGYIRAEFSFSSSWDGCKKVASFWSQMGYEYPPRVLPDGRTCMIPAEALKNKVFKVQVIGSDGNKKLITNKVAVRQTGGKA